MMIEAKLWPLEGEQGFKEIWPTDLDLIWHNPYSNLTETRQSFWLSFMKIEAKLWPLEGEQGFKAIWPSDLVF